MSVLVIYFSMIYMEETLSQLDTEMGFLVVVT